MRKPLALPLMSLALLVLASGCHSRQTARTPQRYQPAQYTFADLNARSEYIDQRTAELTDKGVSREEASARASREWFSQAPAASQVPTKYELDRREAEADIRTYLDKRKEPRS